MRVGPAGGGGAKRGAGALSATCLVPMPTGPEARPAQRAEILGDTGSQVRGLQGPCQLWGSTGLTLSPPLRNSTALLDSAQGRPSPFTCAGTPMTLTSSPELPKAHASTPQRTHNRHTHPCNVLTRLWECVCPGPAFRAAGLWAPHPPVRWVTYNPRAPTRGGHVTLCPSPELSHWLQSSPLQGME